MMLTFTSKELSTNPSVTWWPKGVPGKSRTYFGNQDNVIKFAYPQDLSIVEYQSFLQMNDLVSGQLYTYCFGNGDCSESYNYTFKALPVSDVISVALYGDLGSTGSALTIRSPGGLPWVAQEHLVDFIVHFGDLAYNLCSNKGDVGNQFLDALTDVAGSIPYLTTNGNHESDITVEGHFNSEFYSHWFAGQSTIAAASKSSNIAWYSFDVGPNLHVIVLSTEVYCTFGVFAEVSDLTLVKDQYSWLKMDLLKLSLLDASDRPWVVVTGHRQIYLGTAGFWHAKAMRFGLNVNDSSACTEPSSNCEYALEPLFLEYGVDIVYLGHQHKYWRMLPTGNATGTTDAITAYELQASNSTYYNPQRPVYIVSGAAGINSSVDFHSIEVPGYIIGCDKADTTGSTATGTLTGQVTTGFPTFPPDGEEVDLPDGNQDLPTVFFDGRPSYSVLKVYNNTHVLHTQVDVMDGEVFDALWIIKDDVTPLAPVVSTIIHRDLGFTCDQ